METKGVFGMIIGAVVGWYVSAQFCTPVSLGGGQMREPCGAVTPLVGPFTIQTAIGAAVGALIGKTIL